MSSFSICYLDSWCYMKNSSFSCNVAFNLDYICSVQHISVVSVPFLSSLIYEDPVYTSFLLSSSIFLQWLDYLPHFVIFCLLEKILSLNCNLIGFFCDYVQLFAQICVLFFLLLSFSKPCIDFYLI